MLRRLIFGLASLAAVLLIAGSCQETKAQTYIARKCPPGQHWSDRTRQCE